ncbi:hypothetical protein BBG47_24245 [Paenibacillus sp. KS1]|uniref:stalk domain-containing protein n=1 Tax=Paenibacillus sp. KS1 TaxID=1849249 RepID=UPI00080653B0|nr:stalk domain-containing protein [Paenibacillus sp. KS1]OBY76948.1 hypothetical protein BBG47_24245 [Paenibacillus sp. KS1]
MGKTIRYPFSSHHWRKSVAIMTIAAVVAGTIGWNVSPSPAVAATAAAGQQEMLRLKVGSTSATWNGEKLAIVKPYVRQGTTMVPLSIFTNVFEAALKWEKDNAVILEGDAVSIRMRIGQKQAMMNGKLVTLAVAPEMTGGTAMVPLKQVAQAFGATYSVDKDKSIILRWKQAGILAGAAVDVGAKAARVGDFYYQWNMVIPRGWTHEGLSPEEFAVVFTDPTEHVFITINALDWASKPLEHWSDAFKGQASEQQLMEYLQTEELDDESEMYEASTGKVDGIAYAQSVFINEEDMYLARVFSANGKRYIVRIFDANAQRPKQMLQYVPLINTFRPNFSAGAATNISSVKDGYRNTKMWGKGLTMDLPVDWASSDTYFQSYGSKNWEQSVNYNIATAAPGLTLDQFAKNHLSYLKKTTKSEYLQVDPEQDVKLADGKMAKSIKIKSRVDEKNWKVSMHLLVVDQGVQYLMIYHCPDNSEGISLGNRLFSSVKVDGSVKKDLESPEDFPQGEEWYKDWSVSSTRKAPNYGFTLQVPDWWTSGFYAWGEENYDVELDEGMIAYYSRPDSDFSVYVDQVRTVEEALARWEDYYKGEGDTRVEIVKQEKTTVQGNKAYAVEMKVFSEAGQLSFTVNLLLIAREGKVFSLVYSMEDTARTPELLDSFKRTMESFQFTEQVTNKKS